jgi:hypothetical protein
MAGMKLAALLLAALAGCATQVTAAGNTTIATYVSAERLALAPAVIVPVVGVIDRPTGRPYRVMVVGDSVGNSIGEPLTTHAEALGVVPFIRSSSSCSYDREQTSSGSGFVEDVNCVRIVNNWGSDVDYFRPDAVLFIYGSWSNWYWQGQSRTQCDPMMAAHVTDLYSAALFDLGSTGAPVYFVAPPYWRAAGYDAGLDAAYDCLRDVMRKFVAAHPARAGYIDLQGLVCVGANCDATAGGLPVRADGLHFSEPGASTVMAAILANVIRPQPPGWPTVAQIVLATHQASVAAS